MLPNSSIKNLLTKDQLAALGEVSANSAQLEWSLGWVLMWCLKLNDKQRIAVLRDVQFKARLGLLQRSGKESLGDEALKDQFKAIIKRIDELYDNRNTVIHGTWGAKGAHITFEDEMDMEFGFKEPDGVRAENQKNTKTYSARELRTLADDLHKVQIELWDFGRGQWWKAWTKEIWAPLQRKKHKKKKKKK